MASENPTALLGRTIGGKYRIESYLGGGAMGAVWKARQVTLDKVVAIKIMHRQLAGDDAFAVRFHREALAASRLDHPNSIRVFDHGEEEDGLLYIAMEFCEARDLHHVMAEDWPLSDARIVDILAQALAALAIAHEMGVVHRDLKPENILVQRGTDDDGQPIDMVKVCDFGIATIAEPRSDKDEKGASRSNITGTGFIVGTPEFMSPEQARGDRVDARSDLYSLGVVLYRMLTGALPFDGETALGVAVKHIFEEPKPPEAIKPEVSPRLAAICLKALRKDLDKRYQSAREMRADLRTHLEAGPRSTKSLLRPAGATTPHEKSASIFPSARASDAHPTLSGLPKPTPTSMPALSTPPRRLTRLGPLYALGLVFAGLVLFKLARPSTTTDSTRATTTATEGGSAALDAPSPRSTTTAVEAPASDSPAPGSAGVAPSLNGSVSPSPASAAGLPRIARATPSTTSEATSPVPAATPSAEPAAPPALSTSPTAPDALAPAVVAVAPPPAAPEPAPTPAVPALDPSTARVAIGGVSTTNGLPASSVRSALGRANFSRCYQDALRAAGKPASGSSNLHLAIDDTGHVISATAPTGFLPGARACIEGAARGLRVSNVDTGDATADIALSFLLK